MAEPAPVTSFRRITRQPIAALAVVVTVAALATSGWFGITLAASMSDEQLAAASTRTAAIAEGSRAVATLNSLDHRYADEGLARWERASTGMLHEQINSSRRDIVRAVESRKTITTATVVQAALTELDHDRARIMAVVDVKVQPRDAEPVTKRARLLGELHRDGQGWKLAALTPVHVEA